MSRSFLAFAVLGCLLAVSPVAQAQRPGGAPGGGFGRGGFGFGGGGRGGQMELAALVGIEQVQKEIKLEGEKLEAVKKVVEEQRESMRGGFGDFGNFREMSEEERNKAMAEMREKREAATKKAWEAISAHLTAEQKTRLEQIQLQTRGLRALDDDDIVAKLDLNEDQQLKVAEIFEAQEAEQQKMMEEVRSAGRDGGREAFAGMREKMDAARKATDEKLLAVLTDAQKEKWNTMTGAKFELDRAAMFGGGGGFGGGRPRGGDGGGRQRPATDN